MLPVFLGDCRLLGCCDFRFHGMGQRRSLDAQAKEKTIWDEKDHVILGLVPQNYWVLAKEPSLSYHRQDP